MSQVKLPYYPKIIAIRSESPFGVQEVDKSTVYDQPLPDKTILRVDVLEHLRGVIPDTCFVDRDILYALFSGSTGYYNSHDILCSFYRRYEYFRKLVNDECYFGDETEELSTRILMPIRNDLNEWRDTVLKKLFDSGAKYLVESKDYIYVSFRKGTPVPDIIGAKTIC